MLFVGGATETKKGPAFSLPHRAQAAAILLDGARGPPVKVERYALQAVPGEGRRVGCYVIMRAM